MKREGGEEGSGKEETEGREREGNGRKGWRKIILSVS